MIEIFPSHGGAPFAQHTKKVIRLILKGCANRPFFHISVQEKNKEPEEPVIEQLGNYDPLPNQYNEKLVAINFERLEYWLQQGAQATTPVKKILGISGYFPIHPETFEEAFTRRKNLVEEIKNLKIRAAELNINLEAEENSIKAQSSNVSAEEQASDVLAEEQSSDVLTEEQSSDVLTEEQSSDISTEEQSSDVLAEEHSAPASVKEENVDASDDKGNPKS